MENLAQGIFRIKVPFEDLFTTVYVYACDEGVALIDSATYPTDVDNYIVPALNEAGISKEKIKFLLLTHNHGDHTGGINRLKEVFPDALIGATFETELKNNVLLTDGQVVLGDLQTILLPGHTTHSAGYFDLKTKTLLSGDCLQLKGIGKYRNGICYPGLYINSCEKLKNTDIKRIVAAHEYDPLGSIADGEIAVKKYLDTCIEICLEENKK